MKTSSLIFFLLFFLSAIFSPVTVGFFSFKTCNFRNCNSHPQPQVIFHGPSRMIHAPSHGPARSGLVTCVLIFDQIALIYCDLADAANPILPQEPCTQEFSLPGTSSTEFFMSFTCRLREVPFLAHLVKNNPVTIIFCPIIFIKHLPSPWCIFMDVCVLICRWHTYIAAILTDLFIVCLAH